jgi:arabinofuranosyltransferase
LKEVGNLQLGVDVPAEPAAGVVDDPEAPATGSAARRALQAILYGAPVIGFICAGYAHRWITDDGFIYLRVVQQIRAGNGPVFNAGERVEAFTGALWVALLAVADLTTPARLEWLAVILGLAGGAAGLALAIAGARRIGDGDSRTWFVPLGALVFVVVTPVWIFATSGLETGLTVGWLGACLWLLAAWATTPASLMSLPSAAVLGLGWLVRPDLALFSAAFVAIVVGVDWRHMPRRRRVAFVAAALGLPLAYQLFRMGYYGSLVPNTALAKEGAGSNWERGWRYLRDFADAYWLWVPAIGLVAGAYVPLARSLHGRVRLTVGVFALCGLLHGTYMVRTGGDYIHARLLLPGFFAICAPVAVVPATRRYLASLVVAPWAAAAMLTLRPAQYRPEGFLANGFALPKAAGVVTLNDVGWHKDGPRRAWYEGPAIYFQPGLVQFARADIEPRRDLDLPIGVFAGVGAVSYAMGPEFHVLDVLGLADTFTAHLDSSHTLAALAGHEKALPTRGSRRYSHRPGRARTPPRFQRAMISCSPLQRATLSRSKLPGHGRRSSATRSWRS